MSSFAHPADGFLDAVSQPSDLSLPYLLKQSLHDGFRKVWKTRIRVFKAQEKTKRSRFTPRFQVPALVLTNRRWLTVKVQFFMLYVF
jgi:hypothetical protein